MALRSAVAGPRPVWAKLPSAENFVPLVVLFVGVFPALYCSVFSQLTQDQAIWGLFGLDVIDQRDWLHPGGENETPSPLLAWLTALFLMIPVGDKLLLLTLPTQLLGAGAIYVLYRIGRCWYSRGAALFATLAFGLNPYFLAMAHGGNVSILILFWALACLYCYIRHLKFEEDLFSIWIGVGAIAFAGTLLSGGRFAFILPVIGITHVLHTRIRRQDSLVTCFRSALFSHTAVGGVVVVLVGFACASPWLYPFPQHSGPYAPWAVGSSAPFGAFLYEGRSVLAVVLLSAPALICLSTFGLFREGLRSMRQDVDPGARSIVTVWAVVSLLLALSSPSPAAILFLLAPILLLASNALFVIVERRVLDRLALVFATATLWITVLWILQMSDLWPRSTDGEWNAQTLLLLHLAFDVGLVGTLVLAGTFRLTSTRDTHRRAWIGVFALAVVAMTLGVGWAQLERLRRRQDPWLALHRRAAKLANADLVVVLGVTEPPPQLELSIRTLFPHTPRKRALDRQQLDGYLREDGDHPVVFVTDGSLRLEKSLPFTQKGQTITLTRIFDTDTVMAYAPLTPADSAN